MMTIDQLLYGENDDFSGIKSPVEAIRLKQDAARLFAETNDLATTNRVQGWTSNRDVVLEKARQRNNSYRKRRKVELTTLREQEAKLRQILEKLNERKNQEKTDVGPSDSVAVARWKAVAMRQHENRLEAIALQNFLQSAVYSQAVVIQDFQHALKRRLRGESKLTIQDVLGNKSALDMKDAMFYNAYFDSLSAVYGKLDEIFNEVGSNPTQGKTFAGEPMRKTDGETEYFEKNWVGTVPFTYERTCDAVWALAAAPHRQDQRCQYEDLQSSEDSIGVKYCIPVQNNRGTINMRTYQVARRYVEESRMVVVWRALSDASKGFPGITQDEIGWCIVHTPSRNATDPANTLVQACIRSTPMHFRSNDDSMKRMVTEFMELSMKVRVDDSLEIQHMIESLLLDEALHSDELDFDDAGILDFRDGDEAPNSLIS